jgi:murein DD-endopeptidase MepM/ murein hydrolase activator NlpD
VRFLSPLVIVALSAALARAEMFVLPTANRALFKPGAEEEYFVPTPGKTWTSGTFGCVRTDGHQLHEGLDIKCTKRDRRGEPADPVYAAAGGKVAYLNPTAGLSNYGKYVILQHELEGVPIYTIYAHLSAFASGLNVGDAVKQGQEIATMGRTSNTHQPITKDRAHVHFEIDLKMNERFAAWHTAKLPGERNDHGNWNGKNLAGLDPRLILLDEQRLGSKFSLLDFIRSRPELCRVIVRDTKFPFLRDYPTLIHRNPKADKEGVAGYEIALDFNGVPFSLTPRSKSEIGAGPRFQLVSVNENEVAINPCRKLVLKRGGEWQLSNAGTQLLDLLVF